MITAPWWAVVFVTVAFVGGAGLLILSRVIDNTPVCPACGGTMRANERNEKNKCDSCGHNEGDPLPNKDDKKR